jgi:hypothetical protein
MLVTLWGSAVDGWRSVVADVLAHHWRYVSAAGPVVAPWTLITDAFVADGEAAGAAIVIAHSGRVWSWRWPLPPLHINFLELFTIEKAVGRMVGELLVKNCAIDVFADSTVALAVLRRSYSMSYQLNTVALRLARTLEMQGLTLRGWYLASAINPADAPSRGLRDWSVDAYDQFTLIYSRARDPLGWVESEGLGCPFVHPMCRDAAVCL